MTQSRPASDNDDTLSQVESPAPEGSDTYEPVAVHFATRAARKSHEYYRYHQYGEPDADITLDYYYWVLRNNSRIILIDTGFAADVGRRRGVTVLRDPVDALREFDITPGDVSDVIVSHMHYDHIGNVSAFPNATVYVAGRELSFWSGPYAHRRHFAFSIEPKEINEIRSREGSDRLVLLRDRDVIAPGVRAVRVGGHTPGQLVVDVDTSGGRAVFASDALHFYEEMMLDRPFAILNDLAGCYGAFDYLRELDGDPRTAVVAGHDPAVKELFRDLGNGYFVIGS